jgi:Protein-tyrosine-phosphatase
MKINNILVVCIGNICRSPMAEYFLKQEYPHLNIESAGISGLIGHAADEKASLCMQRFGIDMSPHVAKKLNAELIKKADLILVMSQNQQKHIEQTWPLLKVKPLDWDIGKVKILPILISMIKQSLMKLVD